MELLSGQEDPPLLRSNRDHGLTRLYGKHPDGLTLISWREGRSATWDVTVANSHLSASSTFAASAAESVAQCTVVKYAEIFNTHLFFPLAFESMGTINRAAGDKVLSPISAIAFQHLPTTQANQAFGFKEYRNSFEHELYCCLPRCT